MQVDGMFETTSFKAFCKRNTIEICTATAYNHTIQARAEGAVRICKEHVCCLLKQSNMPPRFWPYVLLHFCRIFNYWPSVHSPPQWESMGKSKFNCEIKWDLQEAWGCYMTAKLPTEHPLVQENKTHADRALESAFLGWDKSTLMAWMFSFCLGRTVRVLDPVFPLIDKYQFRDPSMVINRGHLTDDQVNQMHEEDKQTATKDDKYWTQEPMQDAQADGDNGKGRQDSPVANSSSSSANVEKIQKLADQLMEPLCPIVTGEPL